MNGRTLAVRGRSPLALSTVGRTAKRRDLALLTVVALALLAAASAFEWSRADDASSWDVPLYQSFGNRMEAGEVPYRDFRVEYPPGSLPAFLLPSLVASDGGPVYEPTKDRSSILRSCYVQSLLLADTLGATSIAFPAISAGVYGWPLDDAARIAVSAVRRTSAPGIELVRFALFGERALTAFRQALTDIPPGGIY